LNLGARSVVTFYLPEERPFSGRTLEEALGWCLAWLIR
jgi:hypothetical protein